MINLTLPTQLEIHGIKAEPAMIKHLQQTMSPYLEERPQTV
jgi:hypothetical protein